MAESTVSMKLLIDKRGKRVLFAEAGKDCVDFLFYILSLPLATLIRLLKEESMEGSLPILYKSLENLNDNYIQPNMRKDTYLQPVAPVFGCPVPLLAPYVPFTGTRTFGSSTFGRQSAPESGGLVKGMVTYMVMDDLEIKPMSTISSISVFNNINVKYVGALEEKVVNLGMKEAVKLLNASLQSKSVLTDLFC